jgi:hypothetical protein
MPTITCPNKVGETAEACIEFIPPKDQTTAQNRITAVIVLVPKPAAPHKWFLVNPITYEVFSRTQHAFDGPCGASLSKYVAVQLQDKYGNVVDVRDVGDSESANSRKRKLRVPTLVPAIIVERNQYVKQPGGSAGGGSGGQQAGAVTRFEFTQFEWDNPKAILPENAILQGLVGVWDVTVRTQGDEGSRDEDGGDDAEGDKDGKGRKGTGKRRERDQDDSSSQGPGTPEVRRGLRASGGSQRDEGQPKIESSDLRFNLVAGKPRYLQVSVQLQTGGAQGNGHIQQSSATEVLKFGGLPERNEPEDQHEAEGLFDLTVTIVQSISVCVMDMFGNVLQSSREDSQFLKGKGVTLRMQNGTLSLDSSSSQRSSSIQCKFFSQRYKNVIDLKDVNLSVEGPTRQGNDNVIIVSSDIPGVEDVRIPVSFAATNAVIALECIPNPYENQFRAGHRLNKVLVNVKTEDGHPLDRFIGTHNIKLKCSAQQKGVDEDDVFRLTVDYENTECFIFE